MCMLSCKRMCMRMCLCSACSTTHHPPSAIAGGWPPTAKGMACFHSTQAPREKDLEFLIRVGELYFHVRIVLRKCVGALQVPRLHDCVYSTCLLALPVSIPHQSTRDTSHTLIP